MELRSDPFSWFHRDEGIAYHRKLVEAGVDSTLRFMPGLCHGADPMSPAQMPDEYAAAVSVYAARVAPTAQQSVSSGFP